MGAILLLEDGRRFEGDAFGARTTRVGEAVFNTAMTGYQEILTDPSYAEQVVAMTTPHIGNTGVNIDDPESSKVWPAAFIVRSLTRGPSSWRSSGGLNEYLVQHGVPGMQNIDTRALVRHLRSKGAMRCVVSTDGTPEDVLVQKLNAWPGMVGRNLASEVSCTETWVAADPENPVARFAVIDGGCKKNIVRLLVERGCYVRVHPLTDPSAEWAKNVDAVLVSNGPGDPAAVTGVPQKLNEIIGTLPVVGICLGHQLLALALGATTYKLTFGHRGANQPVRDELTGRIQITSQNHGFGVDRDSLVGVGAEVTHTHLNDQSVSGFRHVAKQVAAVQYHPEANPGPHDGEVVIDTFIAMAQEARR